MTATSIATIVDRRRHRPDRPDRPCADGPDRAAGEHRHRRAPRALPPHPRSRPALPRPVHRSPPAARRHARAGGRVPAAAGDHAGQRDDLDRYGLLLHRDRCLSRDVRGRKPLVRDRAADRDDVAQRDRLDRARGRAHLTRQDQRGPSHRPRRGNRALGPAREPDRSSRSIRPSSIQEAMEKQMRAERDVVP